MVHKLIIYYFDGGGLYNFFAYDRVGSMKNFDEINNQKMGGDKGGELSTMNEVRGLIHKIRGKEVMLDADLARIYGYTTKAFNQQVRNNIEKFEGEEFMFRLTWEELKSILRCQNGTSKLWPIDDDNCLRSKNLTSNDDVGFLRSQISDVGV